MIEWSSFGINIKVKFMFVAVITIFLILDKTGIAIFMFIATITHELGHVMALLSLGYKPSELSFEIIGIKLIQPIKTINYIKEIIIYISGPLINIIMFTVLYFCSAQASFMKVFAYIHLFIGIFNLLPIGTLDGGRVLNLLFRLFLGYRISNKLSLIISILLVLPVVGYSLYLIMFKSNFTLILTSIYLIFMMLFNNAD